MTAPLGHRTDLLVLISVNGANPNGDPLNKGLPRTDRNRHGVISAVCIRRKLRDRFAEMGQDILISPPEFPGDDLETRVSRLPETDSGFAGEACRKWYDVRAFGQVFPFMGRVLPGIKGAVSLQQAVSVSPVNICSSKVTCCLPVSGSAYRPGYVNYVEHGLYLLKGSIIPGQAVRNGFTVGDGVLLREALLHMFDNDCSTMRPAGSMEVERLFWWEHPGMLGRYSPAEVFRSVSVEPLVKQPKSMDDYTITHTPLPGLGAAVYGEPTAVGTSRRG